MTNLCPACETGILVSRVSDKVIQFEGQPLRVQNLHYSECPVCGAEVVLPAQSKRNEVAYADAKKASLGLWSCGRVEVFRKEWGMTQNAASRIFGGGANAFSKYERGEVIHSKPMDLLMRVFNECEDARELLTEIADVTLESVPAWKTIKDSDAPKRTINAAVATRLGMKIHALAAANEYWQTCDVANGN